METENPSGFRFKKRDLILAVFAILVIAWGIYYYLSSSTSILQSPTARMPQVTNVKGGYAEGFPVQYILEKGITPLESAATTYPGGSEKLWSASYVSALDPKEIISRYANLFGFLGVEITQRSSDFIYAHASNFDFSAKAEASGTSTKVVVSYLSK